MAQAAFSDPGVYYLKNNETTVTIRNANGGETSYQLPQNAMVELDPTSSDNSSQVRFKVTWIEGQGFQAAQQLNNLGTLYMDRALVNEDNLVHVKGETVFAQYENRRVSLSNTSQAVPSSNQVTGKRGCPLSRSRSSGCPLRRAAEPENVSLSNTSQAVPPPNPVTGKRGCPLSLSRSSGCPLRQAVEPENVRVSNTSQPLPPPNPVTGQRDCPLKGGGCSLQQATEPQSNVTVRGGCGSSYRKSPGGCGEVERIQNFHGDNNHETETATNSWNGSAPEPEIRCFGHDCTKESDSSLADQQERLARENPRPCSWSSKKSSGCPLRSADTAVRRFNSRFDHGYYTTYSPCPMQMQPQAFYYYQNRY